MNKPTNEQIARVIDPVLWKRYDRDAKMIANGYEILGSVIDDRHPGIIDTKEKAETIQKLFNN